jgi:hypothetical protein
MRIGGRRLSDALGAKLVRGTEVVEPSSVSVAIVDELKCN